MNKFLRAAFIVILVGGVSLLTIAWFQPQDVTIKRTAVIQSPSANVFAAVGNLSQWSRWCAMLGSDSTVKFTHAGTEGAAGSTLAWVGDDGKTGSGVIGNTGVEGTTLHYTFTVTSPGDMRADGTINTRDSAGHTVVTWTFHKHFPFPSNFALLVIDFNRYIGGDMKISLAKLRKMIENGDLPTASVTETTFNGYLVAGVRDTMKKEDFAVFCQDAYSLFHGGEHIPANAARVAVFFANDTLLPRYDVLAGLVVADTRIPVNGIVVQQLPSSKALSATHHGGYGTMYRTYAQLDAVEYQRNAHHWLAVEEYIKHAGNEPDSNLWETRVAYLLP